MVVLVVFYGHIMEYAWDINGILLIMHTALHAVTRWFWN